MFVPKSNKNPGKLTKPRDHAINIRLTTKEFSRIRRIADINGISVSDIVRFAISGFKGFNIETKETA